MMSSEREEIMKSKITKIMALVLAGSIGVMGLAGCGAGNGEDCREDLNRSSCWRSPRSAVIRCAGLRSAGT